MPADNLRPSSEGWFHLALAVMLGCLPILLFHLDPILFAHIVSEVFWGEYMSASAFALAGLLFITDALLARRRSRKAIGLAMGVVALVIAGEEVSWGQRVLRYMFGVGVSDWMQAANVQGETNLHNLEIVGLSDRHYELGAYLSLAWLAASALLVLFRPERAGRWEEVGVPIVPLRLIPLCLLPAFFFLLRPVGKPDEVGELLLGVAAMTFALDRVWSSDWWPRLRIPGRPAAIALGLIAVGLLAAGLAAFTPPGRMSGRLHLLAARDYPLHGLYERAEDIYKYIYANPLHIRPYTRVGQAELFLAAGKMSESRAALSAAVEEFSTTPAPMSGNVPCRIGTLYQAFNEQDRARDAFAIAIEVDRRVLETAATADERAELLWSLARTLEAQGRAVDAASAAAAAERTATSAQVRYQLGRWRQQSAPPTLEGC